MLELIRVSKSYGARTAVDSLSLRVERGEVMGLLGPNGAGKTTTIALSIGLLGPDHGRVELSGLGSPLNEKVRSRIGVAPQELALYEELSASENLRFFGSLYRLRGESLAQRVDWCLDLSGLASVRDDRVETFSGGMKRRLNLAVALIHDPELILLDEPTVGVDPQSRNAIFERVEELRHCGKTIVYTTHYMEEAQRLCDRIAILDRGRLCGLGTVEELLAAHGGPGAVIVDGPSGEQRIATDDPLETLSDLRSQRAIESFRYEPPNLETVFLHLTGRELRD